MICYLASFGTFCLNLMENQNNDFLVLRIVYKQKKKSEKCLKLVNFVASKWLDWMMVVGVLWTKSMLFLLLLAVVEIKIEEMLETQNCIHTTNDLVSLPDFVKNLVKVLFLKIVQNF